MKKLLCRSLYVLIGISMLLNLPNFDAVTRVEAAGEIIEFNDYTIPARNYVATRTPSVAGDPNWYASSMKVDFPSNTFQLKYDQVKKLVHIEMSNSYMPTLVEMTREALEERPKESSWNRAYHGHYYMYGQELELVYSDGSSQPVTGIHSGWGGTVYTNGDLSGYANVTDKIQDMRHAPYRYRYPDHPEWYDHDIYNPISIVPYSNFQVDRDAVPVAVRLSVTISEHYGVISSNYYDFNMYHHYSIKDVQTIPLSTNKKPNLTITSQPGQTFMNENGFSTFNLTGNVQDPDNDTVDVIAEIPNVFYKKISISGTAASKGFSMPIDVLQENIPPGNYTVNVTVVDPLHLKAEATTNFNVTNRLKNKSFVLINTPVDIANSYSDYENDPAYALRYKYEHDPHFFDNSMGKISDSGLWRSTTYPSFPYSGVYVASFQAKDNPKDDERFNAYRKWSRDNLSSMTFHVHRKPIALFGAKLVGGSLQLTDSSYDLDHITASNKGLHSWQWQYKETTSEIWIEGKPPAQLPTADQYDIRLRVRDVDGENGMGVWSDWCLRTIGSSANLPPVALFTVNPNSVSYRKSTTTIDKSFDPDNDPLDIYSWNIVKNGGQQVWSSWGGATTVPNIAAYGVGDYKITLQVHDNRGLWSEPYSQSVQVLNHPPAAAFYMPPEVYRDTVITMENLTPDPDADGDALSYTWNGRLNGGAYYYTGSNRNQVMTIRDLINQNGITHKKAISEGWEMLLTASDGAHNSYATRSFTVKNHTPAAAISGPNNVFQYDTIQFNSADEDLDSSDAASLQYYWKVTDSDGVTYLYRTANISVDFPETGIYTLEHWAVDQIGAKSNIATLKVSVIKNLAPSIILTSPVGTADAPTILDAQLQGDPLIRWTYADPENDPQEKYRLEFYTKDSLLARTIENTDHSGTGSIRQYQVPNPTFARFEVFSVFARAYSKGSWSEISNQKAFIIDNPPVPGFTLNQSSGHRNEDFIITSTATDADIPKGDNITYRYYLRPLGGTESLISASSDFTKQFTTNNTFTIRQVVTDSLGLYRETSRNITVNNQTPTVSITYPGSSSSASPTVVSTLTPNIQWNYQDGDGDLQQRYKVRIIDVATGGIVVQSGETVSSVAQWKVTAGALVENRKYAVEVEAFDGYDWSSISPRKFFMVNLLTVKGGVKHTTEWDNNRIAYNLKKSGNSDSPRGYSVFWAGERFVLQADATGLPNTVEVIMTGGYSTQLSPTSGAKTLWTGELYDSSFEKLPDGPITFTFTAKNDFNTKIDAVTVTIQDNWSEYFRNHRTK